MATFTPNYNLGKPEPTDPFGYSSFLPLFNDNMDKIDQIGGGGGSSWTDIEGVLTAGSTTLTLNSTSINTTSVLNIYVDTFGVCPIDVEVSNGSVTLTFNEMENDLSVLVRITENGAEPSPYTLMNYLEVTSSGAYIDTGVANSATAYFEIDFQYTGTPTNNDGVFGAMGSGIEFVVNSYGGVSYANTGGSRAVFTATNLDRHVIKADNSGILIDDVSSGASVDWSRATGYNYFLFAFNYLNNQKYYTGHAKIYSAKLWNGDTLVRDFIPAIRNEDDEIGMYDRVNDVFYTNNGTGTFTIG